MKKLILIIIFIRLLFIVNFVFADSKILINEFLIDPQPQSVEIFNSGTESADISGWIIDDDGSSSGTYSIPTNSIIYPNACLVFSSNFYLNKSSTDTIRLIDNSQQLIDSFSYKSSSGSGISFFRTPDGTNNWATGSANLGFYNSGMEQTCLFPTLTPTPTSTLTPTLTPVPTLSPTIILTSIPIQPTPTSPVVVLTEAGSLSYDNVYLSEVMVNSLPGEKEWIEIYNNNDFVVSLNNWYVDDLENAGSTPKIFSLEINPKSYGVFDLTSSMFNNSGDSVRLLDFNKNLKDDFEYQKTEQGKTLGRTSIDSDDFCLQEPSKNSVNDSCINPTPNPTPIEAQTPKLDISTTPTKIGQTTIPINRSLINQTPTSPRRSPILDSTEAGLTSLNILGVSTKINHNDSSLINLLTILSSSYSLLTIGSILFRMKLSYGKNKNFYSSSFCST